MPDCPRCQHRGKTWQGDDPRCAFPAGVFTSDNWNCATANDLRTVAEWIEENRQPTYEQGGIAYSQDQRAALIPCETYDSELPDFVLLGWYKQRGRTEQAWAMDDQGLVPLTLSQAEKVLVLYPEAFANAD